MYDFKVKKRDGSELDLKSLKGKVLLIVNTATGCGFTPQYEGLENLYKKHHKTPYCHPPLRPRFYPCKKLRHK